MRIPSATYRLQFNTRIFGSGTPSLCWTTSSAWESRICTPLPFRERAREARPGTTWSTRPRCGAVKLFITARLLRLRRGNQPLFTDGDYLAADASGKKRDFVCGLLRRLDRDWALIAAPRLVTNLVVHGQFPLGAELWEDTTVSLPPDAPVHWQDVLTGQRLVAREAGASRLLDASALFARLPVAVVKSAV